VRDVKVAKKMSKGSAKSRWSEPTHVVKQKKRTWVMHAFVSNRSENKKGRERVNAHDEGGKGTGEKLLRGRQT